jgi:hypothetical protein
MVFSGMLRRVALVRTDVSEELQLQLATDARACALDIRSSNNNSNWGSELVAEKQITYHLATERTRSRGLRVHNFSNLRCCEALGLPFPP